MTYKGSTATLEMPLSDFFENVYLRRRYTLKPKSIENMRRTIRLFDKFVGQATLQSLNEQDVLDFVAHRYAHRKPATAGKDRENLLAIWRLARRNGFPELGIPDLETVRVPRGVPSAFTVDEVRSILAASRRLPGVMRGTTIPTSQWWESLILFLYDTGARVSAAKAVKASEVNLTGRLVVLGAENSKTSTSQVVQISQQTTDAIASHLDGRETVWPWNYVREKLWKDFRRILQSAGVTVEYGNAFHKLRRCHATLACKANGMEAAAKALGHTSHAMTSRYVDPRQLGPCNSVDTLPRP